MNEFQELAEQYWESYRLMTSSSRRDRLENEQDETIFAVDAILMGGGSQAAELLSRLAWEAPDEIALRYLGAAALGDFIDIASASDIILLAEAARHNGRLGVALRLTDIQDRARSQLLGVPWPRRT